MAAGVLLGILILGIFALRGCVQARSDRGISTYVTAVSTIMSESGSRGNQFFDQLENPGQSSDLQYQQQVQLLRGASESLLTRAEELSPPDQLIEANQATLVALRLRRDALTKIADQVTAALGDAEQAEAISTITDQMSALYASDVDYLQGAVPQTKQLLADEGIEGVRVSEARFMPPPPTGLEWLTETKVISALGLVSGSTATTGTHGVGLLSVSANGVALSPDTTNDLSASTDSIDVQVQNQGESEESGVRVTVTINGVASTGTIDTIAAGATATVSITLSEAPAIGTETTMSVVVSPVPGEGVTDNNSSDYPVTFN